MHEGTTQVSASTLTASDAPTTIGFVGGHFVGTSGFASPEIRHALDAPSAAAPDLLHAYAGRFGAVELDSVFTRRPSADTIATWDAMTPAHFRFAVRVPRQLTHIDRLARPADVAAFADTLAPLGDRLACLLFTVPSSLDCDVDLFRAVLDELPRTLRTAWEFRDGSWACPEVVDLLAQRGTAAVVETLDGVSSGEVLPGGELAARSTSGFVYVRLRKTSYTSGELLAWGDTLGQVVREGRDVYAFFKQSPDAGCYARALSELLADAARVTAVAG